MTRNASLAAVTVGTFDGVHRGHRFVVDRLVRFARERGVRSAVVTFEPHPLRIVNPLAAPPLLCVGDEKVRLLEASGADDVVVVPFTREVALLEAERFVDEVLLGRFGMRHLFIGHDHGFGRGRAGDAATLERLGSARGFDVHVVPAVDDRDGRPISSTAIRNAVARGDLARAADGLGRPYWVSGVVGHGEGRGAALGYRTLNLASHPPEKLLPPEGVYAVRVATPGTDYPGMLNLGARPTFGDERRGIEAHIFDACGDWYGESVRVDFIRRLRDVRRFDGPESLVAQLRRDEEAARLIVSRWRAGL
ncbi:MAG: bifunctional riboflavin kinase/FAD synthetase [Gemmatimonadaceae bacterium]|nr:bifunctional riboflavin kinase/FAD synthetase [Gemmatimonadaceae bacterium]